MTDFQVFPDAEAAVGTAIRAANIPGIGGRVYSSVPKSPTFPLIVVRRIGGRPTVRQSLDTAHIQIDVWGRNKGEAHDAAQLARVALHRAEGTVQRDAFITAVEDSLGLSWQPDPDTDRDRYILGAYVSTRPSA